MKITYNEVSTALHFSKSHNFKKYFCNWYLTMPNDHFIQLECNIKYWFYIFFFVPIGIILEFFYCLWDGGLKEFHFPERCIERYNYHYSGLSYGHFEELRKIYQSKKA